jgi:hypothetical protein
MSTMTTPTDEPFVYRVTTTVTKVLEDNPKRIALSIKHINGDIWEDRRSVSTLYPYQEASWSYRFNMPPIYRNYPFKYLEIYVYSGSSMIIRLVIYIKHITLSKLKVVTDRDTYYQGEYINAIIQGLDQDDYVIHPAIRFPLNIRVIRRTDNQVVASTTGITGYSDIVIGITTNDLTPATYDIQASENADYNPNTVMLL